MLESFQQRYNQYNLNQKIRLSNQTENTQHLTNDAPKRKKSDKQNFWKDTEPIKEEHEVQIFRSDSPERNRRREILVMLPTLDRSGKTIIFE